MTTAAYQITREMLIQLWRFFSEWYIPGTNVTPAGMFLLVIIVSISIRFIKRIVNLTSEVEE